MFHYFEERISITNTHMLVAYQGRMSDSVPVLNTLRQNQDLLNSVSHRNFLCFIAQHACSLWVSLTLHVWTRLGLSVCFIKHSFERRLEEDRAKQVSLVVCTSHSWVFIVTL